MRNLIALFSLLLVPAVVYADAMDGLGEVLFPIWIVTINMPAFVMFLIAQNFWKRGKPKVAIIIIGITWFVYFGITLQVNWFHFENYFSGERNYSIFKIDFFEPFYLAVWLPITIVFYVMLASYFLKRFWDRYPLEAQQNAKTGEFHVVQTFEKIDENSFRSALNRFANVLKSIGLWNEEVKTAFENFEWKVEDNGYIYGPTTKLDFYKSTFSTIKIRPLVMVYTSGIDSTFKENWISCELLFQTNQLQSRTTGEYFVSLFPIVNTLAYEMQKEFQQTGIYFTDEAQDGEDFKGIRTSDKSKIWQFDYALIPNHLSEFYSEKPISHSLKNHGNFFEAWSTDCWKKVL